MKRTIVFFELVLSMVFSACLSTNSIKVTTINWQLDDNGYIQFYTTDPEKRNSGYFHFIDGIQMKNVYEIEVIKNSGSKSGFGLSLCLGPENSQERYSFIINVDGYFHIGKNHMGNIEQITDGWLQSEHINTGLGSSNILKVVKSGNNYTFYVNNNNLFTFTDLDIDAKFLAYGLDVSLDENFPDIPVDILFKLITH
jgi:hypothetical protein